MIADIRWWAFWRRLQYGLAYFLVLLLCMTGVYYQYLYTPPSCFDGEQNGTEIGADCGGDCARICTFTVSPPVVLWAKSFQVTEGQYNAVAYVENRNTIAGAPKVNYTITLHDREGIITERRGQTHLPANYTFPIFEGRIDTYGRIPTDTTLTLEPIDLWLPSEFDRNQFKTTSLELVGADARPRLKVEIENTSVTDARAVNLVAVIFNSEGIPLTASQTQVDRLLGKTKSSIDFVWPRPIAKTIRSCDVPSDVMMVLDRSGSMAADGANPPQPLTSAKDSAQSFVELLRDTDQVGYFSYATLPSNPLEQLLTGSKDQALVAISSTKMGEDGIQYTNMGEAFKSATAELVGERARADARKVIVFLTDGDVTRPLNEKGERDIVFAANYARAEADKAKAKDITIYTIGFGDLFATSTDELARDLDLIKDLATDESHSFRAPTSAELTRVYKEIAESICEDGAARIDVIPLSSGNYAPYP